MMYSLSEIAYLVLVILILLITFFWLMVYFEIFNEKEKTRKVKDYPKIAVVIPTLFEGEDLKKSVESVKKVDYPAQKISIYIGLNKASDEKTRKVAKSLESKRVHAIDTGVNGKASVMNYILKNSLKDEQFILTLDADSMIDRLALKRLLSMFDDEKVAVVTPSVAVYRPRNFIEKLQEYDYIFSMVLRKAFSKMDALLVAPGPGSLFRRSTLEKVGYFDEGNITEDMEIAIRLLANGYKIRNKINAFTYTVVPHTTLKLLKQRIRWYTGFFVNVSRYHALLDKEKASVSKSVILLILLSTALSIMVIPELAYYIYIDISGAYTTVTNIGINYLISTSLNDLYIYFFSFNEITILSLITLFIGLFYLMYALKGMKKTLDPVRDTLAVGLYITFFGYLLAFSWFYGALKAGMLRGDVKWRINTQS